MRVSTTPIPDLLVIEPKVFGDARGFFTETWQKERYKEAGIHYEFVQDNRSFSRKGILRGLHFQKKYPQGKLVSVVAGEVFDVAVDLRPESKTFGKWFGITLDGVSCRQFWIPPRFAHGFYVLSETAFFEYKCTDFYSPGDEFSLAWNDPVIGVSWPLLDGEAPLLSEKDSHASSFKEYLQCEQKGGDNQRLR